jgi:hypothetical protein
MKVKLSTTTPQQRREMQEWEKRVRKECLQEAEKYTMDLIRNNFFPRVKNNVMNIIMCYFSENEGWGDKRLKRLFDGLSSMMDEYIDFYNFDNDDDALFVCKYKLKEKGLKTAEMQQPFDFEVDME